MATGTALVRTIERVAQDVVPDGSQSLRATVLEEIRGAVGFDAYAWLLTDPQTEVGAAPLADVPCLDQLPRLIRLKYLTTVNRWTTLDDVALLRASTGDAPERSLVWRDLLSTYDVRDVASIVFRDAWGCWGFLDLWRIDPAPRFSEAEAALLRRVAPPITTALRRGQARTFDMPPPESDRTGPVLLVLSPDLEVRSQTSETDRYLRALVPPEAGRAPIPAVAYNVAGQLLAVESGVDHHPPRARVHLAGGVWLTLRAGRMGDRGPVDERDIAVTIESTAPGERTALFARSCGLSGREAELLGHLVSGADTRRIAQQMFLSEHTVQDHLKSIFSKAGVRTRPALVARALGR